MRDRTSGFFCRETPGSSPFKHEDDDVLCWEIAFLISVVPISHEEMFSDRDR